MFKNSISLFQQAQKHIPGGVNSPVRAFKSVGGKPIFINKAKGAYLFDEDGNKYIDCIASWGPMILGHAHPVVINAINKQIKLGTSYGAPTQLETSMAKLIKSMAPNVDLIRMVNSGTEACMSAVRLARGYTGKNKIIKFTGCYHGHADSFLINAGSGVATLNIQNTPGVPTEVASNTLVAAYNNLQQVAALIAANKNQVAAIIIEPVAGNMGCVPPNKDFLIGLRKLCNKNKIVLIFDEVMTGFRLAPGGAQELFGVNADLICFGKIIGAGLPVGAFGGKKSIMQCIAPLGNVYQAGTLSGNPLAMAAGHALLSTLKNNPNIHTQLNQKAQYLKNGLQKVFAANQIAHTINQCGSMLSIFFSNNTVQSFEDATTANMELFKKYFHFMLSNGVYLPPSPYESWFLNNAMSYANLNTIIKLTANWCNQLKLLPKYKKEQ
jgi:glutamate-1-semialdehyde 2,1-aminomutase